jgi:prolyl oligopeptidase
VAVVDDRVPGVEDPFRWLEDPADPRTVRWLARQRAVASGYLDRLPGADHIEVALRQTAQRRRLSPARRHGGRTLRAVRGPDHPDGLIVDDSAGHRPRIVFDPGTAYPGGGAVLARWDASPTGRYLAAQVVVRGGESATPLHLVDVAGGGQVGPVLVDVRYSSVDWLDDDRFVYVRPNGVFLHHVGPAVDEPILRTTDPMARCHVTLWHGRWLTVTQRLGAATTNTLWWVDLAGHRPPWPVQVIQAEPDATTGAVLRRDGGLLLTTTWGADRGRIVALPAPTADRRRWRVIVDEDPHAVIRTAAIVVSGTDERLVLVRSRDNLAEMTLHDPATGALISQVGLPGAGTVLTVRATGADNTCTFTYTDWVTPPSEYVLDASLPLLCPVDNGDAATAGIVTEHVRYRSLDGTEVPLTLLTPAGGSGPRPTLLTGYGGFGVPFRPSFQPEALAWVRAGGVLAVADVRGGGGRGRQWHRDGCRDRKQNSFADLHAAADWLVATGRTRHHQLVLLGASNGGLLVTGALVQSPERYAAGVALAPLTDMVRYELAGLGPAWVAEYGSASDPEQLRWLLGYSPYHNVRRGRRYPPLLLIAGANDTRVDPLHARKLVAMLQHADPQGGPTLLRMVDGTGHGVGPARLQLDIAATTLRFLAHHAGLTVEPVHPPIVG